MLGKKIEIARKSVDLIREFFSLEYRYIRPLAMN